MLDPLGEQTGPETMTMEIWLEKTKNKQKYAIIGFIAEA